MKDNAQNLAQMEQNCPGFKMASGLKSSGGSGPDSSQKNDKTSFEDCVCPICLDILIRPITMPCGHELCMVCFQENVQETSLTCPMCRLRISSWARKAARHNRLVNEKRWRQIQRLFPKQVEKRLEGEDNEDDYLANTAVPLHLAQPGEIRKEYEEEMKKLEAERVRAAEEEEQASQSIIQKILEEEKRQAEERKRERERLASHDEELAKQLSEKIQHLDTPQVNSLLRHISGSRQSTRSHSSNSSRSGTPKNASKSSQKHNKNSSHTLDRFLTKGSNKSSGDDSKNKDKSSNVDAYPYACINPEDKPGERLLTAGDLHLNLDTCFSLPRPASGLSNSSTDSILTLSTASGVGSVAGQGTPRGTAGHGGPPRRIKTDQEASKGMSVGKSPRGMGLEEGLPKSGLLENSVPEGTGLGDSIRIVKVVVKPEMRKKMDAAQKGFKSSTGLKKHGEADPGQGGSHPGRSMSESDELLREMARASSGEEGSKGAKRSASAQSEDSISHELTHFKPIHGYPRTPPRRLPGGKVIEPSVIVCSPRNLSRAGSMGSPTENGDQSIMDPTSPIVKKRLQRLAEERQAQVQALSKATSTEISSSRINKEHSYSSPTKMIDHRHRKWRHQRETSSETVNMAKAEPAVEGSAVTTVATVATTTLRALCSKRDAPCAASSSSAAATTLAASGDGKGELQTAVRAINFDLSQQESLVHGDNTLIDLTASNSGSRTLLPLVTNFDVLHDQDNFIVPHGLGESGSILGIANDSVVEAQETVSQRDSLTNVDSKRALHKQLGGQNKDKNNEHSLLKQDSSSMDKNHNFSVPQKGLQMASSTLRPVCPGSPVAAQLAGKHRLEKFRGDGAIQQKKSPQGGSSSSSTLVKLSPGKVYRMNRSLANKKLEKARDLKLGEINDEPVSLTRRPLHTEEEDALSSKNPQTEMKIKSLSDQKASLLAASGTESSNGTKIPKVVTTPLTPRKIAQRQRALAMKQDADHVTGVAVVRKRVFGSNEEEEEEEEEEDERHSLRSTTEKKASHERRHQIKISSELSGGGEDSGANDGVLSHVSLAETSLLDSGQTKCESSSHKELRSTHQSHRDVTSEYVSQVTKNDSNKRKTSAKEGSAVRSPNKQNESTPHKKSCRDRDKATAEEASPKSKASSSSSRKTSSRKRPAAREVTPSKKTSETSPNKIGQCDRNLRCKPQSDRKVSMRLQTQETTPTKPDASDVSKPVAADVPPFRNLRKRGKFLSDNFSESEADHVEDEEDQHIAAPNMRSLRSRNVDSTPSKTDAASTHSDTENGEDHPLGPPSMRLARSRQQEVTPGRSKITSRTKTSAEMSPSKLKRTTLGSESTSTGKGDTVFQSKTDTNSRIERSDAEKTPKSRTVSQRGKSDSIKPCSNQSKMRSRGGEVTPSKREGSPLKDEAKLSFAKRLRKSSSLEVTNPKDAFSGRTLKHNTKTDSESDYHSSTDSEISFPKSASKKNSSHSNKRKETMKRKGKQSDSTQSKLMFISEQVETSTDDNFVTPNKKRKLVFGLTKGTEVASKRLTSQTKRNRRVQKNRALRSVDKDNPHESSSSTPIQPYTQKLRHGSKAVNSKSKLTSHSESQQWGMKGKGEEGMLIEEDEYESDEVGTATTVEDDDFTFALKLQKQFEYEARLNTTFHRSHGSGDEYKFRERRKGSTPVFSPVSTHTRSNDRKSRVRKKPV